MYDHLVLLYDISILHVKEVQSTTYFRDSTKLYLSLPPSLPFCSSFLSLIFYTSYSLLEKCQQSEKLLRKTNNAIRAMIELYVEVVQVC
jgi:hypothetical protein